MHLQVKKNFSDILFFYMPIFIILRMLIIRRIHFFSCYEELISLYLC